MNYNYEKLKTKWNITKDMKKFLTKITIRIEDIKQEDCDLIVKKMNEINLNDINVVKNKPTKNNEVMKLKLYLNELDNDFEYKFFNSKLNVYMKRTWVDKVSEVVKLIPSNIKYTITYDLNFNRIEWDKQELKWLKNFLKSIKYQGEKIKYYDVNITDIELKTSLKVIDEIQNIKNRAFKYDEVKK
ncbi:MAG: hypothetical protein ACRC4M_04305 [Mycoplasma sp.]